MLVQTDCEVTLQVNKQKATCRVVDPAGKVLSEETSVSVQSLFANGIRVANAYAPEPEPIATEPTPVPVAEASTDQDDEEESG